MSQLYRERILLKKALDANDMEESKRLFESSEDQYELICELLRYELEDTEKIKFLLDLYTGDINYQDNNNQWTLLHWAADFRLAGMVAILLNRPGINVNILDECGLTPLGIAIDGAVIEVIDLLLEDPRIDINIKGDNGQGYLHHIVLLENKELLPVFKKILNHPNIDVNTKTDQGSTPLHYACTRNHEFVQLLLEREDILVNEKNNSNWETPLFLAFNNNNDIQCAELMIADPRVDVNIANMYGVTLIEKLVLDGVHPKEIELVLTRQDLVIAQPPETTLLHLCIQYTGRYYIQIFELLLKKTNLSVNAQDGDGNTPLHIASQRFNYETFPILLSQPDIDVRIKNKLNQPALKVDLYKVNNKFIDGLVEKILLAPNMDVVENAIPSENGGTFVHQYLLIKAKNMGILKPIPDSIWKILNSNINVVNEAGEVPIMMFNEAYTDELYASKVKEISKILDILVKSPSIEMDAVDENGNNMFLHFLTTLLRKRNEDSIAMNIKEINAYLTMLASKGVNPTLPNNNGQTIVELGQGLPNRIQEHIVDIIAKFMNK